MVISIELLGLTITNDLSWNAHIDRMAAVFPGLGFRVRVMLEFRLGLVDKSSQMRKFIGKIKIEFCLFYITNEC